MSMVLIGITLTSNETVLGADTAPRRHGTAENTITTDMLKETIPSDYVINRETQGKGRDGKYNSFFLKDSVQTVSIEIDENNLNYMFQNAAEKPTVMADKVTIGNSSVSYVGLKTKGNYTLEHAFTDNYQSDRFSLTVNFGKYINKSNYEDKQNFFGVDKISFNNFFFDRSMMKEYCSLALMSEMGLPTPQFGLAKVYINGDYYGVYSMIEALDRPILEQYFRCDADSVSDYLCKPEGTTFLYDELQKDMSPLWEQDEETRLKIEPMLPTVEEWVRKLNCLSRGTDFEGVELDVNSDAYLKLLNEIIDTDEYLRYFAAHSYLCQMDNMFVVQRNFGLYIGENGRSLLVPWDYDLSFGCYSPVTAEATANNDIDVMYIPDGITTASPVSQKRFYKKFPLFNVLFQNDALKEKYHTYMLDCAKIMSLGGTTSDGRFYEPNRMYDAITALTESLTQAVEEPVAERAGYMNGIAQPSALLPGLMNLQKIIAMRSLGVYTQFNETPTTISGKGCDLSRVGNGQNNWWLTDQGNITSVNATYGIFVSTNYNGASPLLNVKELPPEDERYAEVAAAVGRAGLGTDTYYSIGDGATGKVQGGYVISIPMRKKSLSKNIKFYLYKDGNLEKPGASVTDNIYSIETKTLGILVIRESPRLWPFAALLAVACVACFLALWLRKKEITVPKQNGERNERSNGI